MVDFQNFIVEPLNIFAKSSIHHRHLIGPKPFRRQPYDMVKHTQTIRTNCLTVFDYFWGLMFKGLNTPLDKGVLGALLLSYLLSYFLRADASSGLKRQFFKYLDHAKITVSKIFHDIF